MLMARVILVGICAVLAALNFWVWHQPWATGKHVVGSYFIGTLSAIPILASLAVFVFSFFKVEKTPDGQLLINNSHPYFKIINCFSKDNSGKFSICRIYWITVWFIGAVVLMALAVISVFVMIVEWRHILMAIGLVIGGLTLLATVIFGTCLTVKSLRKIFIGQILAAGWQAIKTHTCPIFVIPKVLKPPPESETSNVNNEHPN